MAGRTAQVNRTASDAPRCRSGRHLVTVGFKTNQPTRIALRAIAKAHGTNMRNLIDRSGGAMAVLDKW
jgi:hypothetical protein